jgi:nucleoside-diphosphate-sugar epimerase
MSKNKTNLKKIALITGGCGLLGWEYAKSLNEINYKVIILDNNLHVFYVQKKDLVESQDFLKFKEQIQNDLFTNKGKSVTNNWFDREFTKYYIKNLL